MGASDAPHHGDITGVSDAPCDTPMLFFGNLVKKLNNLSLLTNFKHGYLSIYIGNMY